MTQKDKNEIMLIRKMIDLLKKGYGKKPCKTRDWEDFKELRMRSKSSNGRCGTCMAWEVIEWLEEHITLVKVFS